LVSEPTDAQRIVRAKRTLTNKRVGFELADRLSSVATPTGHRPRRVLGVFQNLPRLEVAVELLRRVEFLVMLHSRAPPNDGGISLGQVAVAGARDASGRAESSDPHRGGRSLLSAHCHKHVGMVPVAGRLQVCSAAARRTAVLPGHVDQPR
jgi:hypothetical protein